MIIILLLIPVLLIITGCREKQDFTEVVSVKFVSDGKQYERRSWWSITTESNFDFINFNLKKGQNNIDGWIKTDESEFNSTDSKFRFSYTINMNNNPFHGDIYSTKKNTLGLSENDIGKTVVLRVTVFGVGSYYYKSPLNSYTYGYVKVKVIDNENIVFLVGKTETSYKVTSLSITYFD